MNNYSYNKDTMVRSGYYNDVIHDRLYFGDLDTAATIAATEYPIFVNGVGQFSANISTGALYKQTKADTSLEGQAGTIPNGEWFVITEIGINLHLSNTQATTPFTDSTITSINITPIYRVSPIPLHDAIISQCTFELYRNANELIEQGNIQEYPCAFTTQGFAGGTGAAVPAVTQGTAAGLQAAFTMNPTIFVDGQGVDFRQLTVYQELESLDQFRGVFKANREIALSSTLLTGYVDFYLVGRLMTKQQHDQFVVDFARRNLVG